MLFDQKSPVQREAGFPRWHIQHFESEEGLWLEGEAALQTLISRDAEPKPVIPPNAKKHTGMSPNQFRPGINISLTTTDQCLCMAAY